MHKYRTVMLTYSDEDIREKKRMNKPEERRYAQCKALDERKARITKRQMRDGCHAKKKSNNEVAHMYMRYKQRT